jgi:uncharacterized surface protein with fasciclin (FAS1) repeats
MIKRSIPFAAVLILMTSAAFAQETVPAQPVPDPVHEMAMVRFAHFSPNAPGVSIELYPTNDEQAVALAPDELMNLSYGDYSGYMQIPAGEYRIVVNVAAGATTTEAETEEAEAAEEAEAEEAETEEQQTDRPEGVQERDVTDLPGALERTHTFGGNTYYTVAILGLVIPEAFEEAEGEGEGGFFDWLRNLFTGADPADHDELAIRIEVYDDDLWSNVEPGEARIRAVHAAPGTAAIDVAVVGERGSIIGGLNFGEVSRWHTVEENLGNLEVRLAGSRAKLKSLEDVGLEAGMINTIFVIGTTVEDVPIEVVVLSDAPQAVDAAMTDPMAPADPALPPAPADPVATEPVEPAEPEEVDEADVEGNTVVDVAMEHGDLSTFAQLLQEADLVDTLREEGPYTVFAPTNEAFDALPADILDALRNDQDALRQVLLYHVALDRVRSADIAEMESAATMAGDVAIIAQNGAVLVGNAEVVEADIEAGNGVIHKINAVLIPEGLTLNN